MEYGILTLLPIVVVVTLALLSKRTLEPLVAGSVVAYMIISGWHFPQAWVDAFFNVASNRDYQWVFMVCALFGSLIALLGCFPRNTDCHTRLDLSRVFSAMEYEYHNASI